MAASKDEIRRWLELGLGMDVTHMLVVCDKFKWEDYPVYVTPDQLAQEVYEEYEGVNMQKVMEIYDLKRNIEEQLAEQKSWSV